MNKYYTGVGARITPKDVLDDMEAIGEYLARKGYHLRSGHGTGADTAFEKGCVTERGDMSIYLPWFNYNGAPVQFNEYRVPNMRWEMRQIARECCPHWDKCSGGAKTMHTRNVPQVLGDNCDEPSRFLICWTKDGKGGGGTGQAIRVANKYDVPVYDLGKAGVLQELLEFLKTL